MKKSVLILAILLLAVSLSAQIPKKMTYQAVVRDASDKLISNKTIGVKISILKGTRAVYSEVYNPNPTTNKNGLISLEIGGGTALTGNFSTIDWADGPYFIKTEIDPNGGTSYTIQGTTQLLSVPYAFYAKTSGPVNENDPIFRASPAFGIKNSDITNWNNKDDSNTNELQTLSINGNRLTISDGNTVALPTGSGGDQWGSQVVASDETLNGDGTEGNLLAVNESASLFDDWDKDVNDDFSGDYNDLTNKPVTFYEIGTTNPPNDINDDIYHLGNISLGSNNIGNNYKLFLNNNNITDSNKLYSLKTLINIGGNASHYGVYNELLGNGSANQFGVYNLIKNSGDNSHYGVYNGLDGTGSGAHYGFFNWLSGVGEGPRAGMYTNILGSGDGVKFGVRNEIHSSGNCWQFGVRNSIYGNGNMNHYGTFNSLSGLGFGDKYGTYSKIAKNAGGIHYAVYGEAEKKDSSYAGYFKGNVYVSQKLHAPATDTSDMKAYIYGRVRPNGNLDSNACSGGFTVEKMSTGRYKIIFDTSPGGTNKYLVVSTAFGTALPIITTYSYLSDYFIIFTWNTAGTRVDNYFSFVVYKK
jgi:hypothetical protein